MFPNGKITKYIVKYDLSAYSPWKQELDWCRRQVFSIGQYENNNIDEENNKAPDGKKAAVLHSVLKIHVHVAILGLKSKLLRTKALFWHRDLGYHLFIL